MRASKVFCFQAEDGVRGVGLSRGLGDVYRGQEKGDAHWPLYQSDDLGQSDPWVSAAVPLRGTGGDLILLASASLVWMAG